MLHILDFYSPQVFVGINVQCTAHAAGYSQIHDVALSLSSRVDQTLLGQLKRRKGKQEVGLQLDKTSLQRLTKKKNSV